MVKLARPVKGPWPVLEADRPPTAPQRWSWPSSSSFHGAAHHAATEARTIRVVTGRVRVNEEPAVDGVAMALRPNGATVDGWILVSGGHRRELAHVSSERDWKLTAGDLGRPASGLSLSHHDSGYRLRIDDLRVSSDAPPHPAALADWIYVAALLDEGPPVYDADASSSTATREAISEALGRGDRRAVLALHRRYRPRGLCSMDAGPAAVARAYADLCYELGELGCFLQLQVRIMGDDFDRTASTSWGEAAHPTQADKLADTGIDVERFFRGLTIQLDGVKRRRELGSWRLARSIRESGRAGTTLPALATMAADPGLDEYNRLRATQVVVMATNDDHALDESGLTGTARAWLADWRAEQEERR
jgi:hypothetical protein